jgi:phosphoglycerate dehydrogenase-like enzyme
MTHSPLPPAALLASQSAYTVVYPAAIRKELITLCSLKVDTVTPEDLSLHAVALREVEFLFTTWGAPKLNSDTLALLPKLKAVFYAAGSIKGVVTDEFWARNIPICSAWAANAVPVTEFTFAQIILGLKQVHRYPAVMRAARARARPEHYENVGAFGTTVGLVSLGQIGRRVAGMLRQLDVHVLAYDPFCPPHVAQELGVTLVSLEEVFARSRVVSLHAPWLKETEGLITGALLASMPLGGTFINTARGAIVNEPEMIAVLQARSDLTAVLDVTWPEPAPADSPLYDLPNVFLTPHVAGSEQGECARMARYMIDEYHRFLHGEPLRWSVSREAAARMA